MYGFSQFAEKYISKFSTAAYNYRSFLTNLYAVAIVFFDFFSFF